MSFIFLNFVYHIIPNPAIILTIAIIVIVFPVCGIFPGAIVLSTNPVFLLSVFILMLLLSGNSILTSFIIGLLSSVASFSFSS